MAKQPQPCESVTLHALSQPKLPHKPALTYVCRISVYFPWLLANTPFRTLSGQAGRDWYHSAGENRYNATGYANPRVDELIAAIDTEMVTYARDALMEETWQIVLGDIVLLPLHHQVIVWAMRDDLQLPINPTAVPWFRIARFAEPV